MKYKNKITGISLIFLLILGCLGGCGAKTEDNKIPNPLKPAPDFSLEQFNGGQVKLSDYAGKVIILDFWATWCPPCRKGIPDFIELQKQYGDKGLTVLGINLDQNPNKVLPGFIKKYGINYPILLSDGKVDKSYGDITGIPTTFVIDRKGRIYKEYVGFRPKKTFEKDIKACL